MRLIAVFLFISLSFYACKTTQNSRKKEAKPKEEKLSSKFDYDKLYKIWDVESINAGGRLISGVAMGDPRYEFTKDGKRIKSYEIPPHSESVDYEIKNDSIFYKGAKDLPSVLIQELTDSTLILVNEKAEWKLYIK
jgi:hypothetical protein